MKRIFLRDFESGEPAAYCGDESDIKTACQSMALILESLIPELINDPDMALEFAVEIQEMTDEEVQALPEL
jgi:hypothetical protein